MSWESKTDYCGIAATNLLVKSSTENRSGQYLEKLGQDGAIAVTKPFGTENATPSNEYVISGALSLSVQPGKVTTVSQKRYALQSVSVKTGAGIEPTVSASSVQIESTSDGVDAKFEAVSLSLSPEEIAQQVIAGAFTLSGTGCELVETQTDVSCTVSPHTKNGDPVASGVHTAHVTVQVTIGQYGTTVPTLTAGTGWDISSPLTCDDPDADMPTWTATLSKPIAKATASQS